MEKQKKAKNGLIWMNRYMKLEVISSLYQFYRNTALLLRVKTILLAQS